MSRMNPETKVILHQPMWHECQNFLRVMSCCVFFQSLTFWWMVKRKDVIWSFQYFDFRDIIILLKVFLETSVFIPEFQVWCRRDNGKSWRKRLFEYLNVLAGIYWGKVRINFSVICTSFTPFYLSWKKGWDLIFLLLTFIKTYDYFRNTLLLVPLPHIVFKVSPLSVSVVKVKFIVCHLVFIVERCHTTADFTGLYFTVETALSHCFQTGNRNSISWLKLKIKSI